MSSSVMKISTMSLILKIDKKIRQILSWPLFMCGAYFMIKEISFNGERSLLSLLSFLGLGIGILLRPDISNKKLNDEFIAKYKAFVYLFTILLLFFSIGLLVFVLFNLDQPNLSDYSNFAFIGYFIAAAVFFLPFEFWLFKNYWFT
jgi:pilus assembly protein TadC